MNDITGIRSGNLIAQRYLFSDDLNRAVWECVCDCGNVIQAVGSRIKAGTKRLCSRSCAATVVYLKTGERFGQWTVVDESVERDSSGAVMAHVACSCGAVSYVSSIALRKGKTKKCKSCALTERHAQAGTVERRAASKIMYQYQRSARNKGREHSLDVEDYLDLIFLPCGYCSHVPMSRHIVGATTVLYNGLDRLDNNAGYTRGNVITCCLVCNRAKRDMTQEDWMEWLENIKQ